MDLIKLFDFRSLGFASLWIMGLSIILVTFGFVHFNAHAETRHSKEIIKQPIYQAAIYAGLMLFCIGLSGDSGYWWESMIWIILTMGFGVFLLFTWKEIRRNK